MNVATNQAKDSTAEPLSRNNLFADSGGTHIRTDICERVGCEPDGDGTHAHGYDPRCDACNPDLSEAGKERLLAAVDEPETLDKGLYGALRTPDMPNHDYDTNGKCGRCGGDAESWDEGCIEEMALDEPGECTCSPQAETPCASLDCIITDKPVTS